jgi:hypothetical protein
LSLSTTTFVTPWPVMVTCRASLIFTFDCPLADQVGDQLIGEGSMRRVEVRGIAVQPGDLLELCIPRRSRRPASPKQPSKPLISNSPSRLSVCSV